MKEEVSSLLAMQKFAARLAQNAKAGDVFLLSGNLGAGKSTFARFFIQALCGEQTVVPSPTFTIMQSYDAKDFTIWHIDLYRLKNENELLELGLDDLFPSSVMLIEWPDIAKTVLPKKRVEIAFKVDDSGRYAEVI